MADKGYDNDYSTSSSANKSANKKQGKPVATPPLKAGTLDSGEMVGIYTSLRTSLSRFAYHYFKTPEEIKHVVHKVFIKVNLFT
jgi:hypothetical protein